MKSFYSTFLNSIKITASSNYLKPNFSPEQKTNLKRMNKALAKFASSFYYNGSMDVEGECLESSTIHDFGEIQKRE